MCKHLLRASWLKKCIPLWRCMLLPQRCWIITTEDKFNLYFLLYIVGPFRSRFLLSSHQSPHWLQNNPRTLGTDRADLLGTRRGKLLAKRLALDSKHITQREHSHTAGFSWLFLPLNFIMVMSTPRPSVWLTLLVSTTGDQASMQDTHKISALVTVTINAEERLTGEVLLQKESMIWMGRENSYACPRLGPGTDEAREMLTWKDRLLWIP